MHFLFYDAAWSRFPSYRQKSLRISGISTKSKNEREGESATRKINDITITILFISLITQLASVSNDFLFDLSLFMLFMRHYNPCEMLCVITWAYAVSLNINKFAYDIINFNDNPT